MFVKDYEYGFQCYVPDDFSEIKKENYESWNVAGGTLHHFVILDDDGGVFKAFSINLLKPAETAEDFASVVQANMEDFKDFDLEIVEDGELTLPNDRTVKRVVTYDDEFGIQYVTYFMHIKNNVLCSTIAVSEEYDDEETIIATVYSSMEEI